MCENCGCSDHQHHNHHHTHDHPHVARTGSFPLRIDVGADILGSNNRQALINRELFRKRNLMVINMMGSPGSGKTTILEETIMSLRGGKPIYIIEGDQYSDIDAARIKKAGANVIQINTATRCHLDAGTVKDAVDSFGEIRDAIVIIENIGNLVCPALFDLGEDHRVIVLSVSEGDDKPAKYLTAFREANVVVFSKSDLLPYLNFNIEKATTDAKKTNPNIRFFTLSATTGEGMKEWNSWLRSSKSDKKT